MSLLSHAEAEDIVRLVTSEWWFYTFSIEQCRGRCSSVHSWLVAKESGFRCNIVLQGRASFCCHHIIGNGDLDRQYRYSVMMMVGDLYDETVRQTGETIEDYDGGKVNIYADYSRSPINCMYEYMFECMFECIR